MGRAFPYRSDCPVPSIGALSGSLIEDCTISAVPAAIWSNPIFQFYPPSTFDMGCFCLPKPSVDFGQAITPSFSAWVTYPSSAETGVCEPLFNFKVRMPGGAGACPTMSDIQQDVGRTEKPIPELQMSAKNDPEKDCDTNWRMSFGMPCVNVQSTNGRVVIDNNVQSNMWVRFLISLHSSESSSSSSSWELTPECIYNPDFQFTVPQPSIRLTAMVTKELQAVGPPCTGGLPNGMYIKSIDSITYTPGATQTDTGTLNIEYTKGVPWGDSISFALGTDILAGAYGQCRCNANYGFVDYPIVLGTLPTVSMVGGKPKISNFDLRRLYPEQWTYNQTVYPPRTPIKKTACNTAQDILVLQTGFLTYQFGTTADNFQWDVYKLWMPQDKWVFENAAYTPKYFATGPFKDQLNTAGFVTKLNSSSWHPNTGAYFGTQVNVRHTEMSNFPKGGLTTIDDMYTQDAETVRLLRFREGILYYTQDFPL